MTDAPPHPNKYQIMPSMTDEQYHELKEDIRRRGVLVAIEFDQNGDVIDGHHRYRAFKELIEEGADLPLYDKIVRKFDTEEEKVSYIVALNVHRRHLTGEQRQELVVKLRKLGYTLSKIAQIMGISIATASRDIDSLPSEERAELKALSIQGSDGRAYTANYAPRIFSTGTQQLRVMQNKAIDQIAEGLKEQYMEQALEEVKAKAETNGAIAPPPRTETISDTDARERLSAFAWYGGKGSHLNWLLPLLPRCKHFIDVYGGSASVLLNRDPSPIETYNDLDGNVVNFFKVLRENLDELVRLLVLSPYSREERKDAMRALRETPPNIAPDIERARQFFILARQTRAGQAQQLTDAYLNAWRFTRDVSQRHMAAYTSQWQNGIDGLAAIASRMRNVQIENYPALHVIKLYNDPSVLLYCDPPYVHDTRRFDKTKMYTYEMSDAEHVALSQALHEHKGLVALSGYPSNLYNNLYGDWHRIDVPYESAASRTSGSMIGAERIECLWTNYPLTDKT